MIVILINNGDIGVKFRQRLRGDQPAKPAANYHYSLSHRLLSYLLRPSSLYTSKQQVNLNPYQKTALITIAATFFLIMVGGLVRAAGAGLGCPDWPLCFGFWIPPTSADQLIGTKWDPAQFNVFHTWLEYINRLIGVMIGLLIVLTAIRSIHYRKSKPIVFYGSIFSVLLVAFQGWLGGVVVKSKLEAWIITAHMLTAIALVSLLIFLAYIASMDRLTIALPKATRSEYLAIGLGMLLVLIIQLALGTQVREGIDVAKAAAPDARGEWLHGVGAADAVHRTFSWIVLIAASILLARAAKSNPPRPINLLARTIFGLVIAQIVFGVGLAYLSLPPALQVLHLLSANLLIASTFVFVLLTARAQERESLQHQLAADDHQQ